MAEEELFYSATHPLRAVGSNRADDWACSALLQSDRHRAPVKDHLGGEERQADGFPSFKVSPAAFFIDGVQNERTPPDWMY